MLFKSAVLDQIRIGAVTLAFRRWKKPTVREGGTLRTGAGVLAVDGVKPVALSEITEADAVQAGFAKRDELVREFESRNDGTFYRIEFHRAGADPRERLRKQSKLSERDFAELEQVLGDLDRRSRARPWTIETLHLIAARGRITAGEIAKLLQTDKAALKRRVRKLKELGLTESLHVGYRLSPRGEALVKRLSRTGARSNE